MVGKFRRGSRKKTRGNIQICFLLLAERTRSTAIFSTNYIGCGLLSSTHDRPPRSQTRKFIIGSKSSCKNCGFWYEKKTWVTSNDNKKLKVCQIWWWTVNFCERAAGRLTTPRLKLFPGNCMQGRRLISGVVVSFYTHCYAVPFRLTMNTCLHFFGKSNVSFCHWALC